MSGPDETWGSETIFRVRAGEALPVGYEARRIIGVYQRPLGVGTNYEDVYVIACRKIDGEQT